MARRCFRRLIHRFSIKYYSTDSLVTPWKTLKSWHKKNSNKYSQEQKVIQARSFRRRGNKVTKQSAIPKTANKIVTRTNAKQHENPFPTSAINPDYQGWG